MNEEDENLSDSEHPFEIDTSTVNNGFHEIDDYDDLKIKDLPEVKRITKLLNLLSHENPFISE